MKKRRGCKYISRDIILFEAPGECKEDNACESEGMLLGMGSL